MLWELTAGIGIIMMISLAPPPAHYSYYAGLILVLMLSYTVINMRFIWATATGWLIVLLYNYTAVSIYDTPTLVLINNNFFFVGANLIGSFACYAIEYYARRDFLLKHLLNAEKEKVRIARDTLEKTVRERTAALSRTNAMLEKEITVRKEAEKKKMELQIQLARRQTMESVGLMAGELAHDLNNILSGVITFSDLLLTKLKEPENQHMAREILKSGNRAAELVEDLLNVARGTASNPKSLNINKMIRNYLNSLAHKKTASSYPDISISLDLQPDLPPCKCSEVHIHKILMNLVNNAFEAIRTKGDITIATATEDITGEEPGMELVEKGRYVRLMVKDNGDGIDAHDLKKIFEPFYTKKKMGRSGTGLELALVWNTVHEYGGTVKVESDSNGTAFYIYIPATDNQQEEKKIPARQEHIHGAGTILVADDESLLRDVTMNILATLGYKVITAESGEEALEYLKNNEVDLVILDMNMGNGLNGLQTYQEIIKIHPGQKAFIMSGFTEESTVMEAMELGVKRFIKKPYNMETLGQAVKEVL